MPMIGGTTSWIGPLVGAILLGTLQQIATVTISSAVNLLIVGLLLVVLRDRRAERHRRAGAGLDARGGRSNDRAARGHRSQQAVRRLRRARRHRPLRRRGRARRPDRPERLRQVDAGQLHLRHAARTRPARCVSTARRWTACVTHERTRRGMARSFQLPRPFATLTVARKPARAAALHRQCAAGHRLSRGGARRALRRAAGAGRARRQGARSCRATSRRWRCASSSSRAPWRPSRSS